MFDAQEKQFEREVVKLNPGEIPEDDLALSPLKLDSQFVDMRAFTGLDPHGINAHLVDPRTAAALQSPANRLEASIIPSRSLGHGTPGSNVPAPVVQTVNEGVILAQDHAQTTVFEISDSSVADQEDGQDGESNKDEGDEEVDKGQAEEVDDSQANPPEDSLEVREGETTPHIENEGVDHSMNADPPGPSVGDEDAARELAKYDEE